MVYQNEIVKELSTLSEEQIRTIMGKRLCQCDNIAVNGFHLARQGIRKEIQHS